jgi:peroxiredoxin
MIGDAAFDALKRGKQTEQHYFGSQLLAPDFTLKTRDGTSWQLSAQRGKVVVMNFWSVTCLPCIEELPSLERLAHIAAQRSDIEVVAISADTDQESVSKAIPANSPLRILFDPERTVITEKYGSKLFPETWVVDKQGIIRLRVDGPRNWASALSLQLIATIAGRHLI